MSSSGRKITLPPLHEGQRRVHDSRARFKVLACGRRWGKTRDAALEAIAEACVVGSRTWWVAPTYQISEVGWREMVSLARQIPGAKIKRGERTIEILGTITVRSADDPQKLRAEGLDFLIMDEAAYCDPLVWGEVLRPSLMDRKGRAMFTSTPRGKNWFYVLHEQAKTEPDWESWNCPTWDNPYIATEEIEHARRTMTPGRFAQEIAAEFVDFEGRVFPDLTRFSQRVKPTPGKQYVMGIDWARSVDYTQVAVLGVADARQKELYTLQGDYHVQKQQVASMVENWRPCMVIPEANSIGQVLIDELIRDDVPIVPFTTTNKTKGQVIDALALAIERDEITLLDDDELRSQFANYTCELLPSGLARYGAPAGLHDDIVIAVALAWYGCQCASAGWEARRV